MKEEKKVKKASSPAPVPERYAEKKEKKEVFGLYYTPPGGYCEECDERYEKGEAAQDHFSSKRHFHNTRNKIRCCFCNAYVQDMKGHLETMHRDMTFQCLLNGCNHPRFTQAVKVIDHVRCHHPREFKKTNKDVDLFRKKMISMPKNIMSFICKQSKVVFHGDVKLAIVHLVLELGKNVPQRNDFIFQSRIHGPRRQFDDEHQLEANCQQFMKEVERGPSRSPSSGSSRSRSRSRSYSPRRQGRSPSPRRSPMRSPVRSPVRGGSPRRGSPPRRSPPRGDRRSILRCHFCRDEYHTLAARKNHMLRDHRDLLFKCALCTFSNMYRRDMVWHLREHHRKDNRYTDDQLVKEFVYMPKDLRKIMDVKCSETEAHESGVWLAVDPNDISKDLELHAKDRHGITGKDVESCYRLMCMGCDVKFDFDEIKEWDEHMEKQPCRTKPRDRSYSRSRSRSPFEWSPNRGGNSQPKRESTPPTIDLEKLCPFCPKELDSKALMETHIRQRHLDQCFICRLDDHYELDLPSMIKYLKEVHGKEDLDDEEIKDYVRYPKSLICIKNNLSGHLFYGQKEEDCELHFKVYHPDVKFSTQHLDYISRIDMKTGQFDSLSELKDHLYKNYPDLVK